MSPEARTQAAADRAEFVRIVYSLPPNKLQELAKAMREIVARAAADDTTGKEAGQ